MSQSINKLTQTGYIEWYLKSTNEPNIKFANWMNKVESKIKNKFNFELLDLPDEDYMMYFESLYTPNQMVQIILESNGLN